MHPAPGATVLTASINRKEAEMDIGRNRKEMYAMNTTDRRSLLTLGLAAGAVVLLGGTADRLHAATLGPGALPAPATPEAPVEPAVASGAEAGEARLEPTQFRRRWRRRGWWRRRRRRCASAAGSVAASASGVNR